MKRIKRRLPVPQHKFGFTLDTFNLFAESALDGECINPRYAGHLKVLAEHPVGALRNDATAKALLRWAVVDSRNAGWLDAVTL